MGLIMWMIMGVLVRIGLMVGWSYMMRERSINRVAITLDACMIRDTLRPTQLITYQRNRGTGNLVTEDFKLVLLELFAIHPHLEYLQRTPEFQERHGRRYEQ
ncbi:hypothetical protein MKX01_011202 [Papaver californicum]|nr:hypothetical protein MKX01_011202 [Papaver californicum]